MKKLLFPFVALFLTVGSAIGQTQPLEKTMTSTTNGQDESRSAIAALISLEDDAWNKGDAEAFASKALPDVVFTNIVGMFLIGREGFQAQHARIFATIYKGSTLKQTITHLYFLKPDVAIVDTLTEVTGFNRVPPGIEIVDGVLQTRLEQVLVRNDNHWRIASFHNVPINQTALSALAPHK